MNTSLEKKIVGRFTAKDCTCIRMHDMQVLAWCHSSDISFAITISLAIYPLSVPACKRKTDLMGMLENAFYLVLNFQFPNNFPLASLNTPQMLTTVNLRKNSATRHVPNANYLMRRQIYHLLLALLLFISTLQLPHMGLCCFSYFKNQNYYQRNYRVESRPCRFL